MATEAKKKYMKEYMVRKRKTDPDFAARQQAAKTKVTNRYRRENRKLITEFKKNGCALCPEKEPCCMSAHHLRNKTFTLGKMLSTSPRRMAEEIAKCLCICENCHRKVHAGLLQIPKELRA